MINETYSIWACEIWSTEIKPTEGTWLTWSDTKEMALPLSSPDCVNASFLGFADDETSNSLDILAELTTQSLILTKPKKNNV